MIGCIAATMFYEPAPHPFASMARNGVQIIQNGYLFGDG